VTTDGFAENKPDNGLALRCTADYVSGVMADDAVLPILRTIQTDLAAVKRQGASHARLLEELMTEVRMVKAAVYDIADLKVSPGEIGALHYDVNRVKQGLADLQARVDELESQRRD
jgi:ubiquinone biosynthesis protein UbiJ